MSRRREKLPQNEWTHAFDLEDAEAQSADVTVQAPDDVKELLARRLEIQSLEALEAALRITPQAGGVYYVSGTFKANLTQECVVSSDPIKTVIEEPVEGWFIDNEASVVSFAKGRKEREAEASKGHAEVEVLDESEDPEPAVGGQIDLGELIVQNLSLAINPYPHKEGAHHDYTDEDPQKSAGSTGRKNPFEALKDWKENR